MVGYPIDTSEYRDRAQVIIDLLPIAPVNIGCTSREAEFIKYGSNSFLFLKVIYANILYDLARTAGSDWSVIKHGIGSDPRIGESHLDILHAS